jgi:5-methylcytosine-specific restriction endonuclease McrA
MAKVVEKSDERNCGFCGLAFGASRHGKRGPRPTYCSNRCKNLMRSERCRLGVRTKQCEGCGKDFSGWKARFCSNRCKITRRFEVVCQHCGNSAGAWKADQKFCSIACRTASTRMSDEHNRATRRRHERKANWRRRLIYSCAPEDFDSVEIFERDGYVCQLCKKKTRPDYRWTHPLYPTLDHIIPISVGGGHTRLNVQCACRACNSAKRNNPVGQLRLIA